VSVYQSWLYHILMLKTIRMPISHIFKEFYKWGFDIFEPCTLVHSSLTPNQIQGYS